MSESPVDPNFDRDLHEMEQRYGVVPDKTKERTAADNASSSKMINIALQVLSEMVAGIAVGAVLGYGLGILLGWKIVCLSLGCLLGFVAGIMSVWRMINRTTF